MKVYVFPMFGFLGEFGPSLGMTTLANKIAALDHDQIVVHPPQFWEAFPLVAVEVNRVPADAAAVVIGHSMGGTGITDDSALVSRSIDWAFGFDPQQQLGSPIPFLALRPSVKRAVCWTGTNNGEIPGHGRYARQDGGLEGIEIIESPLGHIAIADCESYHDRVLAEVLTLTL